MLVRIMYSIGCGIIVTLISYLLGVVLAGIAPLEGIGVFLQAYAAVIGLLAGIWYFFTHGNVRPV
jgi:hypothetical protein